LCLASAGANSGNTLGAVYLLAALATLGAVCLVGGVVAIRTLPSGRRHLEELSMLLLLSTRTWCISTVCYALIAGRLLLIISGASGLVWSFGGRDYSHCVLGLRRLFSFLCFLVLCCWLDLPCVMCHNATISVVDCNSALRGRGLSRSCVAVTPFLLLMKYVLRHVHEKKIRCTCVHPSPMLGPPLLQSLGAAVHLSGYCFAKKKSLWLLLLMPIS